MANRQHGRSAPGGRNPGSRTARTVPVSRAGREVRRSSQSGVPSYVEPEVRRWSHPLEETPPASPEPEPALPDIRRALSCQNQLLSDIKALLERLAAAESTDEKQS